MNQPIDPMRRTLVRGALLLAATGASRTDALESAAIDASASSGAAGQNRAAPSLPLDDAAFNVRAVGKLVGALSGVVTYTWNPGTVYGVVPGAGLPPGEFGRALYRVEGVTQRISRLREDGSVEERTRNWMFYVDAERDEYLLRWRNPYTGEDLEVPP
jgi:hypothetical protein